jgi:hypothetical protein
MQTSPEIAHQCGPWEVSHAHYDTGKAIGKCFSCGKIAFLNVDLTEEQMVEKLLKAGWWVDKDAILSPLTCPDGQMLVNHDQWEKKEDHRQKLERAFLVWLAGGAVGWGLAFWELLVLIGRRV